MANLMEKMLQKMSEDSVQADKSTVREETQQSSEEVMKMFNRNEDVYNCVACAEPTTNEPAPEPEHDIQPTSTVESTTIPNETMGASTEVNVVYSDTQYPVYADKEDKDTSISFCGNIKDCKSFEANGYTWTPHKYNIGDVVYVPQDEQFNVGTIFDPLKTEQRKVPKRFTISKVVITNKVAYMFKERANLLVAEKYVCTTYKDCEIICEKLN